PEASRVVTAVKWSGSEAWRSPSRIATPMTISSVVPLEKPAILSSSPSMLELLSGDLGDRPRGHDRPGDEDDERADGGQEADEAAVQAEAAGRERGGGGDGGDPGGRLREPVGA